ncbi:S24 family peptidase [Nitrosomonas eutropha]|uniref:Peptidase S24-like protein n=2 Tax=Nitrosomonas eutropha TaxID=916 RepID=A0ABX5M869_9PROT|nr:S24 family peptidase [Nitrosomonas eutropha]PXV82471.1 peptidase S24-like protein [Nitrosomonas eutropha]
MDISEIRRKNLAALVDKYTLAVAGRKFKKPDRQLGDMIAGRKSFGEKVAAQMEENYAPNYPTGWLSSEITIDPDDPDMDVMDTLGDRLLEVMRELRIESPRELAKFCNVSEGLVSQWFSGQTKLGPKPLLALSKTKFSIEWLLTGKLPKYSPRSDIEMHGFNESNVEPGLDITTPQPSHRVSFFDSTPQPDEVVIPQYDAGGSMGNGLILDGMVGVIKSWHVDHEWLRLNVRRHTGVNNLCIVTGFGPSMQPMFNPGDPLLMDRGVTEVDSDAVYFFRVGNHGYIKTIQRIPTTDGGVIYRAKSKNSDYDPFDIVEGMDFEVFGKILTVWKSEQF